MKKLFISILIICLVNSIKAQTTPLKGVTFGFGLGWSYLGKTPHDYFLTTDAIHKLQLQKLSRSSVTISSVVTIKLGHLSLQNQTNATGTVTKQTLVSTYNTIAPPAAGFRAFGPAGTPTNDKPTFGERLAINVALNLAEISEDNVSFNKAIDGGIGLGYFINEFSQVGVFFDMIRIRQIRDHVVKTYLNEPIPNGAETFNALDENNNSLFYNKYFPGLSLKIIFSLGNK